ncbi:MAG: ATP-binding protein [Actinobacteria bacterium]|nr:ATP-binding protein [Actinomycetota bacterium]
MIVTLQQPTLAVTDNLRWTRSGVVYAEWLLAALPNGHEERSEKTRIDNQHRHLFSDLGTTILTSVVAPIAIPTIAEKITSSARRAAHRYAAAHRAASTPPPRSDFLTLFPDAAIEASARLAEIETQDPPPAERLHWLSVPLCGPARGGDLPDGYQPTAKDVQAFTTLAADTQRKIPGIFRPQRVSEHQMHWLWERSHTRGVDYRAYLKALNGSEPNPSAPRPFPHRAASAHSVRRRRGFRLDGELDPRLSRAVKVGFPDSDIPPSYQTFLLVDDYPAKLAWPGVADQVFALLNHFEGTGVDYTLHTWVRNRADALAHNASSLKQLAEQMDERDSEVSFAQNFLVTRGQQLAQYNTHLEANPAETEIHFCPIIAVSAPSYEELRDRVQDVHRTFKDIPIKLVDPAGAQEEAWAACQPGYAPQRVTADYTHVTATDNFSKFTPITAAKIGDDAGPCIGECRLSGFHEPVYFDLLGVTEKNKSASFALVGDLGSGKSVLLKVFGGLTVDHGGQVFAIDRSPMGEYVSFAESVANAVVIDPTNPQYTLDLLRVVPGADVAERILPVLMRLFQIKSGSPESTLLSDLIEPNYRARHKIKGLPELVTHTANLVRNPSLATGAVADAPPAVIAKVASQLRFWSQRTYARVLFANDLPPLPLDAPFVVLRTNRLSLPEEKSSLADDPTKLFGDVIYTLFATIARQVLFSEPDDPNPRFGLFLLDEARHLTRSAIGDGIIEDFVIDGRKHDCAIGLASQDPAHFRRFTYLIPTLFLFRQVDETLATEELRMASKDAARDRNLVKQLMTDTSPGTGEDGETPPERRGECLMKDIRGRLVEIKIKLPARGERAAAVSTTPGAAA